MAPGKAEAVKTNTRCSATRRTFLTKAGIEFKKQLVKKFKDVICEALETIDIPEDDEHEGISESEESISWDSSEDEAGNEEKELIDLTTSSDDPAPPLPSPLVALQAKIARLKKELAHAKTLNFACAAMMAGDPSIRAVRSNDEDEPSLEDEALPMLEEVNDNEVAGNDQE
eukprot:CAMPEP_0167740840 /NCGR_PEP_ID=MMETSP0110_2-20121227/518_1 /TAXON_ID=629695 /ORGANISM="Gymnochlora sp., Strain CCMP2014" /LENGTH=170 /DNA_ID=CAMNT_0007624813 /DNA_START=21 /DNA_END=533 /DNA_ORIENTATION=+